MLSCLAFSAVAEQCIYSWTGRTVDPLSGRTSQSTPLFFLTALTQAVNGFCCSGAKVDCLLVFWTEVINEQICHPLCWLSYCNRSSRSSEHTVLARVLSCGTKPLGLVPAHPTAGDGERLSQWFGDTDLKTESDWLQQISGDHKPCPQHCATHCQTNSKCSTPVRNLARVLFPFRIPISFCVSCSWVCSLFSSSSGAICNLFSLTGQWCCFQLGGLPAPSKQLRLVSAKVAAVAYRAITPVLFPIMPR